MSCFFAASIVARDWLKSFNFVIQIDTAAINGLEI